MAWSRFLQNSPEYLSRDFKPITLAAPLPNALRRRFPSLRRKHLKRLGELGYSSNFAIALAALTQGDLLADYEVSDTSVLSQKIERAAILLAKLGGDLPDVVRAIDEYEILLAPITEAFGEVRPALRELRVSTALICHAVLAEIRHGENRLFSALSLLEKCDPGQEDLLQAFEAVAAFTGAAEIHLFNMHPDRRKCELQFTTAKLRLPSYAASLRMLRSTFRRLSSPLFLRSSTQNRALILDAGWPDRFETCWSIPVVGKAELGSVLQFGFEMDRDLLPRDTEILMIAAERLGHAASRCQRREDEVLQPQRSIDLVRRVLRMEEMERRRISRELHDGPAQSLAIVRLQMELLGQDTPEKQDDWKSRLIDTQDLTDKAIAGVRRLITDLHPAVLQQSGLTSALQQLIKRFSSAYPCRIDVDICELPSLDRDLEVIIYRLLQESLSNIQRHSYAKKVKLSLDVSDTSLRLTIVDDGVGFDVEEALTRRNCYGLIGIRERATLLGGSFQLRSTPNGGEAGTRKRKKSTTVIIDVPFREKSFELGH